MSEGAEFVWSCPKCGCHTADTEISALTKPGETRPQTLYHIKCEQCKYEETKDQWGRRL